jgi:hypothetical protein
MIVKSKISEGNERLIHKINLVEHEVFTMGSNLTTLLVHRNPGTPERLINIVHIFQLHVLTELQSLI